MQRRTENESPKVATPVEFSIQAYFQTLARTIPQLPYSSIQQIISTILRAFEEDRSMFVFGNGGSAATASHVMCDLNKGTIARNGSRRLRVISLTDNVPSLTAWANDAGYEHVYSEQLKNFVQAGDIAFAISGSGNSPNILEALRTARKLGAVTIGIAGNHGGKMKAFCDICAVVPSDNIQVVEDLHHAIAHSILTAVRHILRSHSQQTVAVAAGSSVE